MIFNYNYYYVICQIFFCSGGAAAAPRDTQRPTGEARLEIRRSGINQYTCYLTISTSCKCVEIFNSIFSSLNFKFNLVQPKNFVILYLILKQ